MSLTNTQDRGWISNAADRLSNAILRAQSRVVQIETRRRAIARTYRELDQLSDRNLADLGFARCDLRRIARQSIDQI